MNNAVHDSLIRMNDGGGRWDIVKILVIDGIFVTRERERK